MRWRGLDLIGSVRVHRLLRLPLGWPIVMRRVPQALELSCAEATPNETKSANRTKKPNRRILVAVMIAPTAEATPAGFKTCE